MFLDVSQVTGGYDKAVIIDDIYVSLPFLILKINVVKQSCKTYYGIHRCTYFMTHICQECGFKLVRFFCFLFCGSRSVVLLRL